MIFPVWGIVNRACACPKGTACTSPGKHPLTPRGVKDATDDPKQIAAWEAEFPGCNWALATGNGIFVVDLDRKPGKDGITAFQALAPEIPRTRTIRTGSGGLHLYFKGDAKNSVGANGIDIRGSNGYVLIPPSAHVSGGAYSVLRDIEPIEAPEWLMALLTRPAASAATTEFPAATAEILESARLALQRHGPAIEGSGGDMHTWRAAALLVNDFALTEEEAWPLFVQWNAECQPPWSETDLAAKLQGGAKYASGVRGSRRKPDPVALVRAEIEKWDGDEANIPAMMDRLRPALIQVEDTTTRAVIETELVRATGFKPKQLAIPKPRPRPKPSEIMVTPRTHEVADESLAAIQSDVFQRNGSLVEVVNTERTFIYELDATRILDLMSQRANYLREDEKGLKSITAPLSAAQFLHSRRGHPDVRILEAVTTAPIFLADGTILRERGYNASARVYLEPNVDVEIPDQPTRKSALDAVAMFRDLLGDYKFASEADFSSWLAALLSPLVKAATANAPAPLFCVSASSPGAGKTLLTDVISRIVTGSPPEVRPYNPKDPGEWGKRLTAFVKAASPVSVFDNIEGEVGDEALNRLVTSATWSDRLLGASDAVPLPNVSTWVCTGNNISPVGDTVRRSLMVRIEVDTERPQERTGFARPLLAEHAQTHRSELLAAALTILRAYHLAGRPAQRLPAWGSFMPWSELVRGALVWSGTADPFLTQQRLMRESDEPENDVHDFWITVIGQSDGSAPSIAATANAKGASEVLRTREILSGHILRKFLTRFVDKPRSGKRIRRSDSTYYVETIQ